VRGGLRRSQRLGSDGYLLVVRRSVQILLAGSDRGVATRAMLRSSDSGPEHSVEKRTQYRAVSRRGAEATIAAARGLTLTVRAFSNPATCPGGSQCDESVSQREACGRLKSRRPCAYEARTLMRSRNAAARRIPVQGDGTQVERRRQAVSRLGLLSSSAPNPEARQATDARRSELALALVFQSGLGRIRQDRHKPTLLNLPGLPCTTYFQLANLPSRSRT